MTTRFSFTALGLSMAALLFVVPAKAQDASSLSDLFGDQQSLDSLAKQLEDKNKELEALEAMIKAQQDIQKSTEKSSGESSSALETVLQMLGGNGNQSGGGGENGSGGGSNPLQDIGSNLADLEERGTLENNILQILGTAKAPAQAVRSVEQGSGMNARQRISDPEVNELKRQIGLLGQLLIDNKSIKDILDKLRAAVGPNSVLKKNTPVPIFPYNEENFKLPQEMISALPPEDDINTIAQKIRSDYIFHDSETQKDKDKKRTLVYNAFVRPAIAANYAISQNAEFKLTQGDKYVEEMTGIGKATFNQVQDLFVNSRFLVETLKHLYEVEAMAATTMQLGAINYLYGESASIVGESK